MSDNVAPQSRCHLLGLPSEIRLLIYEELFPPRCVNMIRNELALDTAILSTCRTIHKEAKPVLYENTEFHIELSADGRYFGPAKRMRPLFKLARKLSLTIELRSSQERKLRKMTSELTRLDEAPHLKRLHIKFKTYNSSEAIQWQFDLIIGVLGLVALPAGVTVMLDPSLMDGYYDFQLSKWFESLDKLNWVDITYEVYSKELTRYAEKVDDISKKFQDAVRLVASTGTEGHDIILESGHGCFEIDWDLVNQVEFYDPSITAALELAKRYDDKLDGLREDFWDLPLEAYAVARAAHEEAKRNAVA